MVTVDSAQLQRFNTELKLSEQIASQVSKQISNELGKSAGVAAGQIASQKSAIRSAIENTFKSDYSGIGKMIGNSIAGSMQSSINSAKSTIADSFKSLFQGIGQSIGQTLMSAATAPLRGGFDFVDNSVDQAKKIETLTTSLKFVSGSSSEAATNMKFLRETSDQLGYSLTTLIPNFNKIAASTKESQLEGEQTRNIFFAIAQAGRVLGLSNEQVSNSLLAVSQMAGKGVVSMEELRGQLGESFPGAIQIFARSMGLSVAEFTKLVENGQVTSDKLSGFAKQINKEMGDAVPKSMQTAAAASANLENTIAKLQEKLGKGLEPATTASAKFLVETLSQLENSGAFETLNAEAEKFANFLKENPQYAQLLGQALNELLTTGITALVEEARKLLEFLEKNPEAIKESVRSTAEFASLVGGAIRFCGDVARTLKQWNDWLGQSNDRFNKGSDNLLGGVAKFLEFSKGVLDAWTGIASAMGMAQNAGQAVGNAFADNNTGNRLLNAIAGQESGGDPGIVNRDSGALGLYQIMPENLPSWSKAALGREVSRDEFLKNPQLQTQIASHHMGEMYKRALASSNGNEEIAVRKVAAEWYSGQQSLYDDGRPQSYGGNPYPSIRAYTMEVLNKYRQQTPLPSSTAKQNGLSLDTMTVLPSTSGGKSSGLPSGVNYNSTVAASPTVPTFPIQGETRSSTEKKGFITGQIGDPRSGHSHQGEDYAFPEGTPVLSALDGVITKVGQSSTAGNYIEVTSIQNGKEITTRYLHLSAMFGKEGGSVKQGAVIGQVGNTGTSSGPHLHFEAWEGDKMLNPENFLRNAKTGAASNESLAQQYSGKRQFEEEQKRAQEEARRQAEELLKKRRADQKAITDRQREERDRDLKLQRETEDADTATRIAKAENPQIKAQLENQRSIIQQQRSVDDQIQKAKDELADLMTARSVKVEDKVTGGVDFTAAIARQQKYIKDLENFKKSVSEAPKAEWIAKVNEETKKLTNSTNEQNLAIVGLANQYENGDSPALQHLKQLNSINEAYDRQKQAIEETVKSAKELAAVAPSAELSGIIGRGEENLRRLSEGQNRAVQRANQLETQAEKERDRQRQLDAISASGERRNTLTSGRAQLLQGQIAYGQTIGGDTRSLQRESALLQESLRYEAQIDGLKQLQIQGKISTVTLDQLTDSARQLNEVNLQNINAQFDEVGGIIRENLGTPLKGFFTDLLTGTKSIGDAFRNLISSMLSSLAQLAVNKLFTSLFGGLFGGAPGGVFGSGGLGLDLGTPILNFASGGVVGGNSDGYRTGYGEISKALQREGPGSVLAALTKNELVLDPKRTRRFFQLGMDRVLNFSSGGVVGGAPLPALPNLRSQVSGDAGNTFNLPITVNGDAGGIDPIKLRDNVQAFVQQEILRQQRPKGLLG